MRIIRKYRSVRDDHCKCRPRVSRRGSAAAELAVALPFLLILFVIIVDFGRIFYFAQTIENCARAGAIWASDAPAQANSPYANVTAAALADAANLSPQPTVDAPVSGTDAAGNNFVRVTVRWTFPMIMRLPAVGSTFQITRTVQLRKVE